MKIKKLARNVTLAFGRWLPSGILRRLGNIVRDLELEEWMRHHGLLLNTVVNEREELFEMVGREIGDKPVLYLEFGVAKGDATRVWSRLLKHPQSQLHGFDSFEGLPEAWTSNRPKGMFSTGGVCPDIGDLRVHFFKGMFDQTLPTYVPPSHEVAVLNMDADLYSSTIFVLRKLEHLIQPGTYLYFDEFSSHGHEERAFREFVEETGKQFRLRGSTEGGVHVLFQCIDRGSTVK